MAKILGWRLSNRVAYKKKCIVRNCLRAFICPESYTQTHSPTTHTHTPKTDKPTAKTDYTHTPTLHTHTPTHPQIHTHTHTHIQPTKSHQIGAPYGVLKILTLILNAWRFETTFKNVQLKHRVILPQYIKYVQTFSNFSVIFYEKCRYLMQCFRLKTLSDGIWNFCMITFIFHFISHFPYQLTYLLQIKVSTMVLDFSGNFNEQLCFICLLKI